MNTFKKTLLFVTALALTLDVSAFPSGRTRSRAAQPTRVVSQPVKAVFEQAQPEVLEQAWYKKAWNNTKGFTKRHAKLIGITSSAVVLATLSYIYKDQLNNQLNKLNIGDNFGKVKTSVVYFVNRTLEALNLKKAKAEDVQTKAEDVQTKAEDVPAAVNAVQTQETN